MFSSHTKLEAPSLAFRASNRPEEIPRMHRECNQTIKKNVNVSAAAATRARQEHEQTQEVEPFPGIDAVRDEFCLPL